MPLLDHFHPPLLNRLPSWESFHSFWTVAIAEHLNGLLPRRYIATVTTHLGSQVEADVAEFESPFEPEDEPADGAGGGVAVQTWAPPATTLVAPAVFPDDFEVRIHDQLDGAQLVAAVELASPRNKDRPESRRAFAAKCAAYLQRGIGLIAVDIVTSRHANLHNELAQLMGWGGPLPMPADALLYAVAYRPARRQERNEIDIWPAPLEVDGTLPLLPLALKRARAIPLDLEATYTHARQRSRL
ncbi:MAG TPA: DUF4058 family protein [Gemmataceae bacterium]|jgi:hypothetical protein